MHCTVVVGRLLCYGMDVMCTGLMHYVSVDLLQMYNGRHRMVLDIETCVHIRDTVAQKLSVCHRNCDSEPVAS